MSLSAQPLVGHEMADVASLEADGEFYRCYVYRNKAQGRIEAYCEVVQPSGQTSMVFQSVIDENPDESSYLDCPKIIAVGTTFVVHWIETQVLGEGDVDNSLYRASMDMTAFDASVSGWTDHGAVAMHDHSLYDVCPIYTDTSLSTHATDFVIAYKTGDAAITVRRYDGMSWALDIVWDAGVLVLTIYQAVLGVYANDVDNDVVLSYMKQVGGSPVYADDGLWTAHLDADDGGGFAESETFPEFCSTNGAVWLQVTHEYMGPNVVAVVAEALDVDLRAAAATTAAWETVHHIIFRTVNSTTSANDSNAHWFANYNLCSRAFSYVRSDTPERNLYILASYKSLGDPENSPRVPPATGQPDPDSAPNAGTAASDWEQAYFFGLNLDYSLWDVIDTGADLRARPVQTIYTTGIPDARPSGNPLGNSTIDPTLGTWETQSRKRTNHLSHAAMPPPTGPDVKTRSVAAVIFAGLRTQSVDLTPSDPTAELAPENAGISEIKLYLEDPWTVYRNGENGDAQPLDNFKGHNSRAMCQAVEVGKSTFLAGGTPYIYDGKQVVECGFPTRPEAISLAVSNSTGSLANSATYYVYFVRTWRDGAGQLHRSGPSPIYTFTTGVADDTATYAVRTETISLKDALSLYPMAPPMQIEVFRTVWDGAAAGTLFYRVFGGPSGTFGSDDTPVNDPTDTGVLITDGVSDAMLEVQGLGPYQYATDAQGNITGFPDILVQTPPAMHAVCVWQNRLWYADSCDEAVIGYSDEILPDYGSDYYQAPTFSDSQTFRIGEVGEIVAMHPMNNDLIVFTTDAIYAITAQANLLVAGVLEVASQVLHEGTGCIEPRSIVLSPLGIFFQSAKGYYLLDRGRQLNYASAGEAIEDDIREAGNIRSATLLEDRHQVRLVCNGRPVRQWTTTFTVTGDADNSGDWTITIQGVDYTYEAASDITPTTTIADGLHTAIQAGITSGAITNVESVTSPASTVVVVWTESDEVPAYTSDAPSGNSLTGVDASETTTYPRVLLYDYRVGQWSRAALVQTNADERLSEAVDGCAWRGLYDATTAHVVLAQGALMVERGPTDSLAFTDQTSVGNVGIPIDLQTSWQHFAGIAGYQRVRSIGAIASKLDDGTEYSVDLDYCVGGDYEDFETDSNLTVASTTPGNLRVRPRIQKLTAIRVRIYEDVGVENTENISVTGLVFEVGVKRGTRKVPDTRIAS